MPEWRNTKPARAITFYLIPVLVYMVFFSVYPLVYSLYLSFTHSSLSLPTTEFVGLKNYADLVVDPSFGPVLAQTLEFVGAAVGLEFCIGLLLALVLNQEFRGVRAFRFICMLPMMMMPVVVALMWRFMYHGDIGLVNFLLNLVELPGTVWLGNQTTAMMAIILTDVWQWTAFCFLVLLAGLQSLPMEPFEAARVDGASRWAIFTRVTLPMLKPAIVVALLFRIMDAFKVFDFIFVMTGGGPGQSTYTMSFLIFRWAFYFGDTGMASALSYVLLIIVSVVFMLFARLTRLE